MYGMILESTMIRKLTFLKNWQDTQNPFRNFAVEEYLMNHVEKGEVILFLWQNRHTVVIGRNQNGWHECNVKNWKKTEGFSPAVSPAAAPYTMIQET